MTEGHLSYGKAKNCKRKRCLVLEDACALIRKKILKRIILALTKPSYLLGLGAKYVRSENRNMLCRLLCRLVRQHNWAEASGTLSMFMKGTYKDRSPATNRLKFSLSTTIVKHIEGDRMNPTRIKNFYDVWMRKVGSMKHLPVEDRFVVNVEYVLFCLLQGNIDEAHQAALWFMQDYEFGKDAMSNMILGMTFYELWYSNIPKQLQQSEHDEPDSPTGSDMSRSRFNSLVGSIEDYNAVCSEKADTSMQCNSETSVRNDRRTNVDADNCLHTEARIEANVSQENKYTPQNFGPQGLYTNSAESTGHEASLSDHGSHMQYGSVFSAHEGLDSWMLPIKLPNPTENFEEFIHLHKEILNDRYREAVKYLQHALNSTPPMLAALLPLVQLLLIGDQVKEAMSLLEKFRSSSGIALPDRLRANLLELHVDQSNHVVLSTSFEDILKKDPTCGHSLSKLIMMHKNGYYNLESLVGMIALHLDATFAEHDTWKEFALCFVGLHHNEGDQMSVCQNGSEEGKNRYFSYHFSRTPRIFTEGKSGKNWRLRCRWWLTRHFSKTMISSEIAAGDLQLLTYKAACAAQMYGKEFHYVVKAKNCLESENTNSLDLLDFLRPHIQNPINIYSNIQQRTKKI